MDILNRENALAVGTNIWKLTLDEKLDEALGLPAVEGAHVDPGVARRHRVEEEREVLVRQQVHSPVVAPEHHCSLVSLVVDQLHFPVGRDYYSVVGDAPCDVMKSYDFTFEIFQM